MVFTFRQFYIAWIEADMQDRRRKKKVLRISQNLSSGPQFNWQKCTQQIFRHNEGKVVVTARHTNSLLATTMKRRDTMRRSTPKVLTKRLKAALKNSRTRRNRKLELKKKSTKTSMTTIAFSSKAKSLGNRELARISI